MMRLACAIALTIGLLTTASAGRATAPIAIAAAGMEDPAAVLRKVVQLDPSRGEALAMAAERQALALAPGPVRDRNLLTARYFRTEALIALNRTAEAGPIVRQALAQLPASIAGTKVHGQLLMVRAAVAGDDGQAAAAMADLHAAYRIFINVGEARNQAVALIAIGLIYQDAGEFERALYYYRLADEAFPDDPLLRLSNRNNQAIALSDLHRYADAEQKYRAALSNARQLRSPLLVARILNNIADTQIQESKLDAAGATLRQGMTLAQRGSPAAEWRPMLVATSARYLLARRDLPGAIAAIEEVRASVPSKELETQAYRDFHHTAYDAYRMTGNQARALEALESYRRIDDQSRKLVTQTSAALLAARFDFANQNARISMLKAGQLRRDVALAEARARQSAIILSSLLAIAVVVAVLLALYLRVLTRSRRAAERANAELSQVNGELVHALSAKSRFLATTSHEIRTPLNGVLGMTQVLLSDATIGGEVRERIGLMQRAGETMKLLVDDILEYAKIDTGNVPTTKAPFDLALLLDEVTAFWRPQASAKQVTLTLDRDGVPRHIVEDAQRVRQILFNLLSNALKFTASGRIAVEAAVEPGDTGEVLVVRVSDTGIGIPVDAYESIFEKFNQLDSSTTRQYGGTGLGLAISRTLARALGGELTVSSVLGSGSVFALVLPLVRAVAPAAAEPTAMLAARELADARVALVGGSLIAQSVLAGLLRPAAAEVAAYPNVDAFLSAGAGDAVHLVILETMTVGPDDVARLARSRRSRSGPAIILLADAGTAPDDLLHPQVRVLIRPINAVKLLQTAREALDPIRSPEPETSLV